MLLALFVTALGSGRAGAAEPAMRPEDVVVSGRTDPRLASFDRLMRSFLARHRIPGGALAVSKNGRLVYARGFGYADLARAEPVQPRSLFRVASVSKPITAVAVLKLVDQKKLQLDDRVLDRLPPELTAQAPADARWRQITLRQLLQHRAGWDRDKSFDPMFRSLLIAKDQHVDPPADARAVIRYMLGQPLDFDPGSRMVYSNFGYCLLGRVIERATGEPYETAVRKLVLDPSGVGPAAMRLGRTLPEHQSPGEVHYYSHEKGRSVFPPNVGQPVENPYGAWNLEAMDAHGGWLASAPALLRFAAALDRRDDSRILSPAALTTLFERPTGDNPRRYYASGWNVVVIRPGSRNTWHTGSLPGTATLLVRRHDGLHWAVLLNTRDAPDHANLIGEIDPRVHEAADAVKEWPDVDLFERPVAAR